MRPIDGVTLNIETDAFESTYERNQLRTSLRNYLQRGDAWPTTILPNSEPINPIEYRQKHPSDATELQLRDEDDDSVAGAKLKAA